MRIISRKALTNFAAQCPDAKGPLDAWFHEAKYAKWGTPTEITEKYGSASILKDRRVVFNIGGNKYRLIVKINYDYGQVFIRFVGTHKQYDQIDAEEV